MVFLLAASMRAKGKITFWDDEKGYGFITPAAGGKQVFVHIKAFSNRNRRPAINQLVAYALAMDKQGRPRAERATLAGDRLAQNTNRRNGSLSALSVAVVFLVIVGVSVIAFGMRPMILLGYLVVSLITFSMYAVDKSAARKGAWRIKESTLHLLSLAGGWPGALIAQNILRHKSRKQSFRAVFRVTVVLNGSTYLWLLTPSGKSILHSLIAAVV